MLTTEGPVAVLDLQRHGNRLLMSILVEQVHLKFTDAEKLDRQAFWSLFPESSSAMTGLLNNEVENEKLWNFDEFPEQATLVAIKGFGTLGSEMVVIMDIAIDLQLSDIKGIKEYGFGLSEALHEFHPMWVASSGSGE